MLYIAIFLTLILLRYSVGSNERVSKQLYFAALLFLYLFAAFRFEVGCDWGTYRMMHLVTLDPLEDLWVRVLTEPFFIFSSKIIHFFNLEYYWMNVLTTSIFFLGIHKLALRSSDPLSYIILLFPILIINMPMSAVKQGAAIGMVCMAFCAFFDKRLLKYVIFIVLAGGFHLSALIFLALVPFVGGPLTLKRAFFGSMIALPIIGLIALSSYADLAVNRYIESNNPEAAGAVFRIGVLIFGMSMFFFFFKNKWKLQFPNQYSLMLLAALMTLVLLMLLPISSVLSDRFGYYLIPILTIFFVSIPTFRNLQLRPLWISAPYLGLILIFITWTSLSTHFKVCYQPYKSWVIGVPEKERYYGDINEKEEASLSP